MPSVTRYLEQTNQLAGMNVLIDSYRPNFVRGNKVVPAHIDQLRNLYNTWITHYHRYLDYHFIRFGNLAGQPGTSTAYRDSTVPVGATSHDDPINAGATNYKTFGARVINLANKFNDYVQEHFHEVFDSF